MIWKNAFVCLPFCRLIERDKTDYYWWCNDFPAINYAQQKNYRDTDVSRKGVKLPFPPLSFYYSTSQSGVLGPTINLLVTKMCKRRKNVEEKKRTICAYFYNQKTKMLGLFWGLQSIDKHQRRWLTPMIAPRDRITQYQLYKKIVIHLFTQKFWLYVAVKKCDF